MTYRDGIVRVQIDLEQMRHGIVSCFNAHTDGLKEAVEVETLKAIKDFDMGAVIGPVVQRAMTGAVEHSVRQAIYKTMYEGDTIRMIAEKVGEALAVVGRSEAGESDA